MTDHRADLDPAATEPPPDAAAPLRRPAPHKRRNPRPLLATNRPGEAAFAFAEETGCDYATALVMCNMD